jgi:hypothetical protein
MKQKLELTWIGKGEEPELEPRILIEQPGSTENFALIRSKGDQAFF